LFHKAYAGLLFKTDQVMAPYCYRCPFNRAKPERADAREYRKCKLGMRQSRRKKFATQKRKGNPYAAFVFEPLMQGSAGMIPQPDGWLRQVTGHRAEPRLVADCRRGDDRVWQNWLRSSRRKEAHFKTWTEVRASSRRLLRKPICLAP